MELGDIGIEEGEGGEEERREEVGEEEERFCSG